MTTDRDFDRIARTWLSYGPDELPERVVDAVADQIHHTRQRHGVSLPRRFPQMLLSARGAAILLVAALVGVAGFAVIGGAGGRPAPSTWPSSSPAVAAPVASPIALPPLTRFFDSPRSGYSVGHPAGWTEQGAQYSWLPGTDDWYGSAALDVLQGPDARFVGASQPLLGQTTDAWLVADCLSFSAASQCADVPAALPKITAARITGYLLADGASAAGVPPSPTGKVYEAVFFFGSLAYDFRLDGNVDAPMFQAILDTVRFAPEDAVALPDLSGTFVSPTYGYSVRMANDWTATRAATPWVGIDNNETNTDSILFTGTDTGMNVASQRLPAGKAYDDWLVEFHAPANIPGNYPLGCDGGEPSAWPAIQIGDQMGGLEMHCNAAEALVHVGDRAYVFTWGNSTFDTTQHFSLASWKDLLKTVTFDPASAKP